MLILFDIELNKMGILVADVMHRRGPKEYYCQLLRNRSKQNSLRISSLVRVELLKINIGNNYKTPRQ